MEFFTDAIIGKTQSTTPEGYLVARDVVVARCGRQTYHTSELPDLAASADGWISVDRDPSEVFDPTALSSLSGKPIVDDHPDVEIGPDNWSEHTIGFVSNPRRGTEANSDAVIADLVFTTRRGIDLVRNGKRALSVGYNADYDQTVPGFAKQKTIRANHVAVVSEGRCGPRCAIGDAAPRRLERKAVMRTRDAWQSPPTIAGSDTPEANPRDPLGSGVIGAQETGGPPGIALHRRRAAAIAAADAARSRAALRAINEANRKAWAGR